ncbi:MAG: hypothetical protein L0Z50_10890, partial [Verrucomicrobiales bacterium]|nr:hypothetical protein [Verrucomicrobiales bacterium]
LYASQKLTLKLYPDQLLLFHQEKLIATHPRSYENGRRRNFKPPAFLHFHSAADTPGQRVSVLDCASPLALCHGLTGSRLLVAKVGRDSVEP